MNALPKGECALPLAECACGGDASLKVGHDRGTAQQYYRISCNGCEQTSDKHPGLDEAALAWNAGERRPAGQAVAATPAPMTAPAVPTPTPPEPAADPATIRVHTASASLAKPGATGWAAVLAFGKHRRELSGGFQCSTPVRGEMFAVVTALESLKRPCVVTVHTDRGWLASAVGMLATVKILSRGVGNADLYGRMAAAIEAGGHRVKGVCIVNRHNEPNRTKCETLALASARQTGNPEDAGMPQETAETVADEQP